MVNVYEFPAAEDFAAYILYQMHMGLSVLISCCRKTMVAVIIISKVTEKIWRLQWRMKKSGDKAESGKSGR